MHKKFCFVVILSIISPRKLSDAVPDSTLTVTLMPSSPFYFDNGKALTLTCEISREVTVGNIYIYSSEQGLWSWIKVSECSLVSTAEGRNISLTCQQNKIFILVVNEMSIIDHNNHLYCQIEGPCLGNACLSSFLNILLRVPVSTIQLKDGSGQSIVSPFLVQEGYSRNITCDTSPNGSRPKASFSWYKRRGIELPTLINDQSISSPAPRPVTRESDVLISYSTLSLMGNKAYRDTYIFCTAVDDNARGGDLKSFEVQLSIVYPPVVQLLPQGPDFNLTEGSSSFNFTCEVTDANPPAQPNGFRWIKQTNVIPGHSSSKFTILNVSRYSEGQYQCEASNSYGTGHRSNSVTLVIHYGPTISQLSSVQIEEGKTLNVTCNVSANPQASVAWTKSGQIKSSSAFLIIPSILRQEDGDYTCTASNILYPTGEPSISKTTMESLMIDVFYGPGNSINLGSHSSKYVVEESHTSENILCNAVCNPVCIYRWLKDKAEIKNTSALSLGIVNRSHAGNYTCEAYNSFLGQRREMTVSLEVIVRYAPDVRVNISGYTLVGSTAVLMCTPQGNPPQYTFHPWIHMVGQTEIRRLNGENKIISSTLNLSDISIQDMGTYICTVNNSITGIDGQINQLADICVHVQGLSFIGKTQSTFAGETNRSAIIEIPFYSNPSVNAVKFWKLSDSLEISNTSDISFYVRPSNITMMFYNKKVTILGYVAVLYFRIVKDTDFDNYTLQLSNDQDIVSLQFDFIVSAPPSVPTKLVFSHIDNGLLVFGIEKGFNGGHEQTFIVEYQSFRMRDANWSIIFKINETGLDNPFTNGTYYFKIPKMQDGHYTFRVYAENVKGKSSATEGVNVEIKTELPYPVLGDFQVGAVAGGIVGGIVLVIAIVAIAFVIKRRSLQPKMGAFEKKGINSTDKKYQKGGLVDNPVYDDSDSRPGTGIAVATHTEDPSKVYAQVDKTNKNKNKAASKVKHGKTTRGDIYENATQTAKSSAENVYENPGQLAAGPCSGDSVYENPEASVSKGQLVNKDNLLYADLKFGPPAKKAGKPVIHGLENQTEYAEIAYGKRGEPLPESDEKKNGGAK